MNNKKGVVNFGGESLKYICKKLKLDEVSKTTATNTSMRYRYVQHGYNGRSFSIMVITYHSRPYPIIGNCHYIISIREKDGELYSQKQGEIKSYDEMHNFIKLCNNLEIAFLK